MRNHEVTQRHQLLDLNGRLMEPGWSKDLVQVYDRRAIKAPKFRIKEWDYYLVLSDQFACAFTLSDDGYIGLQSVSLLDFTKPWEHTETILNAFPMGKMKMPSTSAKGNVVYRDKRLAMEFIKTDGQRRIRCAQHKMAPIPQTDLTPSSKQVPSKLFFSSSFTHLFLTDHCSML